MRRARPELRGRLRYRGCARGPRLSLLHVRLSEAAARALRGCERRQGAPGPVIAFQGSQGSLTVPGGPGEPPRLFVFFLSRCSRDEQQSSFECVRLAVPRLGESRLDTVGSIQEKITICAVESSCPALREQRPQPEESWGQEATELSLGRGVLAQRAAGESCVPGKGSAHRIPESTEHRTNAASPGASVQSLVQLLALQPRGKHEPVQLPPGLPGRGWLPGVLQEVAEQDPTESCCCLREGLQSGAREDRPGPWAPERRRVALLQRRNQHEGPPAQPFPVPLQQSRDGRCLQGARRSRRRARRLALLNCSDLRGSERSRAPDSAPSPRARHRRCPQAASGEQPGAQGPQQPGPRPLRSPAGERSPESGASAGEAEGVWEDGDVHEEQLCPAPGGAGSLSSSLSVAEVPDYLRKYGTIRSAEQCRAYEVAFSADYAEYRYLHARIGGVSRKFVQLGARMKTLEAGTEERKALEATILREYGHVKRMYPRYQQEKRRCEYLHQKLSHIKNLILHFEGSC